MYRIGILSTASIAPRFINACRELDNCKVCSIASRSMEKAREKADLWDIERAYGSYGELIASDVDIVYVAMINSEHYRYARLALENGRHVFCEKPMTLSEQQSRELFALAKARGLFIMEMQKTLFLPAIKKVKEIIDSERLGAVRMADFSSSFKGSYNSWMNDPEKGGGAFYNNLIYSVELMQYFKGCGFTDFGGLSCRSSTGVAEQFAVSLLMEDGTLVSNKTSTLVDTRHFAYIYGERGHVEIPEYWKARSAEVFYNDGSRETLDYPCDYELVYEIKHALECIENGLTQSPVVTEKLTVDSIRLINEISDSWK